MSAPSIEIIMPLRNPGEPLRQSIASLTAQIDREFSVLLSDNFSTDGTALIDECRDALTAAGVKARVVQPSFELGRVEHWNWAHHQAEAHWLKPLFVGDTLKPEYVARLRERAAQQPGARVVRCGFESITPRGVFPAAEPPCAAERLSPAEFLAHFPQHGNWLGGPVNFAYEQTAWRGSGGYPVQLPAVADVCLYVSLVLQHGLELLPGRLAAFHLHDQRFSHGIRGRRVNGMVELFLILCQARNYCVENELPWPEHGVIRGTLRQAKIDYWEPFKQILKRALSR